MDLQVRVYQWFEKSRQSPFGRASNKRNMCQLPGAMIQVLEEVSSPDVCTVHTTRNPDGVRSETSQVKQIRSWACTYHV